MKKVLLVEDETDVASFIQKGLTEEGYEVTVAFDGPTGLRFALAGFFDVIILDLMLPQLNGLDVCRRIRNENKKTPILFLTAVGTPESIVQGLGAEADDYLVKPFKFIELLARIKSLLRRAELPRQDTPPQSEGSVIRFADLWVNDYSKTVKRGNQIITLTSTEYRLLLLFMKNPERVFSRVEILDHVWGVDFNMGTNVVDVYINYLRKKIDKNHSQKLLHTVIGMGYVLKQKDEDPD